MKILLFTLPAMVPMFLFWIYPILKSGWLSFTDWDYMSPSYSYVGTQNYTDVLTNDGFWSALSNTAVFAIGTMIPTLVIGLFVALLLFVGIPLPGTGAWTGTLAASILDLDFKKSVIAVVCGVILAGVIMGLAGAGLFGALGARAK